MSAFLKVGDRVRTRIEDVAFGGAGLFSPFLGPRAGRLFGIEGDREAVRCAGINLCREGLPQAEFLHGDVADILRNEFASHRRTADVVVFDPPRDGCSEGSLEGVAAVRPERFVYVSCNPATQVRDVRLLAGRGYGLRLLRPLDMFPQTAHIEVVALLTWGAESREQNAKGDGRRSGRCGRRSRPPHGLVPEGCKGGESDAHQEPFFPRGFLPRSS